MNQPDSYMTIKEPSETEIKIKGSKFIGRAIPCLSADGTGGADEILRSLRKKYYDATHHCFAYRVGIGNKATFRYSDDGEPSGTAGRPIYDQIEGQKLTNLIVIVTRYFGGTKLGTGGLARAYSETAKKALDRAGIIERFITRKISMTLAHSDYNNVKRLIEKSGGNIDEQNFAEVVRLTVEIRLSLADRLIAALRELTSGRIKFDREN
jgi:uncharacterized YigZ family protein